MTNFKVLIYRFYKYFKTYLMHITSYNIPSWCKTRSRRNHLWYCNV